MVLFCYDFPMLVSVTFSKGPSINNVSFKIEGRGSKNALLRRFLGLKLRRQGEGGGSRNPKLEETSFMNVPMWI